MSARIRHAIVRPPGPDALQGLTEQSGAPTTLADLEAQHAAYCRLLQTLGVELIRLDPLPGFPDAYFVEDTAVITPEVAVVTRPGAPSRRGEEQGVARILEGFRPLKAIVPPGTLEGGDVMVLGQEVFIGLSARTNREGAAQLAGILTPLGYTCSPMEVPDGLHLKSSVAPVGSRHLLIKETWSRLPAFDGYAKLIVADGEAHACNALAVNGHLIVASGYPETRSLLDTLGPPVRELDTGPFRRMDGGLSCLSLRF